MELSIKTDVHGQKFRSIKIIKFKLLNCVQNHTVFVQLRVKCASPFSDILSALI